MPRSRILLLIGLLICLSLPAWAAVKVIDVEIDKHKYYDTLLFKTSEYVVPKAELSGNDLIIDFKNAQIAEKVAASKISSLRIWGIKTQGSKVIVKLKRKLKFELASLFGRDQVMVEVAELKQEFPAVEYFEPGEKPEKQEAVKAPVKQKYAGTRERAKKGEPILKGKVIVIDPGHGGRDPGGIGRYGVVEKNLTLSTSLMLASMLKKAGATVFLTRNKDMKKNLSSIASFVNRIRPDVFVSVHYNYYDSPSIKGTEVYYYNQRSRRMADIVQANLVKGLRRQNRGVKRIKFYIINRTQVPSIIVEPLYITNPEEAILAKSKAYQKKVAWNITAGLKEYFKWLRK